MVNAVFDIGEESVRVTTGGDVLGSWALSDVAVEDRGDALLVTLGGESVLVDIGDRDGFSAAMSPQKSRKRKRRRRRPMTESGPPDKPASAPDFVGTTASVGQGEKLYAARCLMCHGTKKEQPDVVFSLQWQGAEACSDIIRPAVFSYGIIKRGPRVEDIYMSVTAGVGGSPMLAWGELLSEQDRWHLTSYILDDMGKLGGEK
jgi:mono/diheme cytochrome c family protein